MGHGSLCFNLGLEETSHDLLKKLNTVHQSMMPNLAAISYKNAFITMKKGDDDDINDKDCQ